jgi:hypothetical protein
MKKYYLAGTDEEVMMGDVITIPLVKDFEGGRKVTREMEFKVTEDTIPLAIEMEILEVDDEEEENDDLIDFDEESEDEEIKDALLEKLSELVEKMAHRINELEDKVNALEASITKQDLADRSNGKKINIK